MLGNLNQTLWQTQTLILKRNSEIKLGECKVHPFGPDRVRQNIVIKSL